MQRNDRKPPTIKDVAARAGVSVMTASRAINGKALVSPSARQAVARAVEALGYVPNASARALAGSADQRVALLHSNSTTSAYLGELLLGALAEAPQRHLHLVVEQCAPGASAQEVVDQVAQADPAHAASPSPTNPTARNCALSRMGTRPVSWRSGYRRVPVPDRFETSRDGRSATTPVFTASRSASGRVWVSRPASHSTSCRSTPRRMRSPSVPGRR